MSMFLGGVKQRAAGRAPMPFRHCVDLEHRLLDTYGDRATEMQGTFDSPQGWSHLLSNFASAGGQTPRR